MMDKTKRLKAIANKQAKQTEISEKLETTETRLTGELEKFVGDLDRLLSNGIHIENLSDMDSVSDTIKTFGVEADSLIDRLAKLLSSIPELEIPEKIELSYDRSIGDELRALQLELPEELTEKIAVLDARLEQLAKVLSVKQAPSKRVEDYQPVRIVVGDESNLHYLLQMPSSFGSGGGGGTVGGATSAKQDTIIGELQDLRGFDIPAYDEIELGYTGDNLTTVVYKLSSTTVATLTLSYTGENLTGVVLS